MKPMQNALVLFLSLSMWSSSASSSWLDWWQTPEQQAADALKRGDLEALQRIAPNNDWRGISHFETGDFDKAAQSFNDAAVDHALSGKASAENDAIYNQGVGQVRNKQYQEAIDSFNTVLERDPTHADAEHNLGIAEQLMQLQQQQPSDAQSGDTGDENSEQEDQQSQSQDGKQQQSESDDQSESTDGQQSQDEQPSTPSDQQSGGEEQQQDGEPSSDDEEQDQRDAERALAAEAANAEQESSEDNQRVEASLDESPMSEADQSAEQLLRRIPDDPAGLLRRKLEQSHRSEYPEVGDARQPW